MIFKKIEKNILHTDIDFTDQIFNSMYKNEIYNDNKKFIKF